MAFRRRSTSGSKPQLKEKVVQIYESFFKGEDVSKDNDNFWDEFYLLKPKISYIETEMEKLSIEQLITLQDNIRLLFIKCITAFECQHQLRIIFSLKFVSDGILRAELSKFLTRELAEDGYSGIDVCTAPSRTEIVISATRIQNVLGDKGRRIRELTSLIQKRFDFKDTKVELFVEKVAERGLCAVAQAESLHYKLIGGLAVRRACYGVLRFIMESGAKGGEVVVSGKLRGQRAKSMKFVDRLMIHSGDPCNDYINVATKHVLLRQGVLGIKIKIMLPWDQTGKLGPKKPLPDNVSVEEPKDEILPIALISDIKSKPEVAVPDDSVVPVVD